MNTPLKLFIVEKPVLTIIPISVVIRSAVRKYFQQIECTGYVQIRVTNFTLIFVVDILTGSTELYSVTTTGNPPSSLYPEQWPLTMNFGTVCTTSNTTFLWVQSMTIFYFFYFYVSIAQVFYQNGNNKWHRDRFHPGFWCRAHFLICKYLNASIGWHRVRQLNPCFFSITHWEKKTLMKRKPRNVLNKLSDRFEWRCNNSRSEKINKNIFPLRSGQHKSYLVLIALNFTIWTHLFSLF